MNRHDLDDNDLDALLAMPEPGVADDGFSVSLEKRMARMARLRMLLPFGAGLAGLAVTAFGLSGMNLAGLLSLDWLPTGSGSEGMSTLEMLAATILLLVPTSLLVLSDQT